MLLTSEYLPLLYQRAMACGSNSARLPRVDNLSFPALVGAVTLARHSESFPDSTLQTYLTELGKVEISSALDCLEGNQNLQFNPSAQAADTEFFRLKNCDDILTNPWTLFCDRFGRRMQRNKSGDGFRNLRQAIFEIADNVFEHAGNTDIDGCECLAGFNFSNDNAIFSIADVGQGFLGSLQSNPRWKHLKSSTEAVSAVIRDKATSRVDEVEGNGFSDLFSCLIEYNATVLIRSGSCFAKIYQGPNDRVLNSKIKEELVGSQITVVVKNSKDYVEVGI